VLTASYTYATGALEGGISVDASACVLLCTVVQGSASVRIDVDGNVKEEWIDIKGHGRGSATTVLLWGFGNGYFNIDARLDLSGPDLTFSGRASWSMKAKTWWGLKNIVDDWMDVSFDHDRVTIVAGQQWRKRERIKNLRGELYPVKRVCGDYWFKHNTPWDDYDFRGYWGDCDEHGNVPIGTVTGEVRIDSDRSGTVTDADAPVAGQVVVVERTDGTVVGKGRTDSAGRYSIRVTAGSNLRLKLDPMVAGHDKGSVWPASVSVTNGGATDVGSALLRVLTFGSATGTAFHDVNDNGERDAGEPGVAGVRVVVKALYGSAETRTVTTDATGRWTVGGLDDRYSYQAELTGTGGFWVRDDPYRIDEHLVWVHPGAEEPVESPAVALIDEDLPDGGARIEGRVTILASCSGSSYDPFGPMPSYSYAYAGYDRSCDPYGMPYETTPTGADDIIVHLSTGHISRADAWSGQFSMSGVPVGTHRYWVSTPQGYADGEVTVDAEGQTVWLNPRVGR